MQRESAQTGKAEAVRGFLIRQNQMILPTCRAIYLVGNYMNFP